MAAGALVLTGCELKDRGDNRVNGKQLFVQRCGACHTLARAGTRGRLGPNLDDAFRRSREDGLGASAIEGVVEHQILYPRRGSRMPAKLVSREDAEDVAAYVAATAAAPGRDTGALAQVGAGKRGGPPGRGIFTGAAGCGSCHALADAGTSGTTGPNLDKVLKGRSPAFIRESIVAPNASIARGFQPNLMPGDYRRRLGRKDLDALVDYLATVTK